MKYVIFVFLGLAYFTWIDDFQFHQFSWKWCNLIIFNEKIEASMHYNCVYIISTLPSPFSNSSYILQNSSKICYLFLN